MNLLRRLREVSFRPFLRFTLSLVIVIATGVFMANTALLHVRGLRGDVSRTFQVINAQKNPDSSPKYENIPNLLKVNFDMPLKFRIFNVVSYDLTALAAAALLLYALNRKED